MAIVIPDTIEVEVLTQLVTPDITMRLYGNDVTPAHGDTAAGYTEITGGGYANKVLTFGNWTITPGEPSTAVYISTQEWIFSDIITAPGTIYGYFYTRNTDGKLVGAERFPSGVVPFSPINGSIIRVLPVLTAQSEF